MIRLLGSIDAAEEAVQDAFIVALERWPSEGVPANPGAWITHVARNRAIDRLEALRADDRLRLIFTCCHPGLAIEARVGLTLKLLGGLSTAEVARAFLVSEPTMAQRLVRAKKKIAGAGIPYEVPDAEHLPGRLPAVLTAVYLIFNEGYLAVDNDEPIREELCAEAIRLGHALVELMPREPEVRGLLALMLLTDARRPARLVDGELVPLT